MMMEWKTSYEFGAAGVASLNTNLVGAAAAADKNNGAYLSILMEASWWQWVLRRERADSRVASFVLVVYVLDSV